MPISSPTGASGRIARNTAIMYLRMLVVLGVNLVTVRVLTAALGLEDYGIYTVVAGVVSVLTFISLTLQTATQRFFSFAMGENRPDRLRLLLRLSLLIFIGMALVVVLLGETAGLWLVHQKLVIPPERVEAARLLYQFALVSFIVTVMAVPFTSLVIAHEDMGVYAVVSLGDAVFKLLIVYALYWLPGDKLVVYGLLLLLSALLKEGLYALFCFLRYDETKALIEWHRSSDESEPVSAASLLREMLSYSGWSLFGTVSNVCNDQGNHLLVNLFFGPLVNASRGIAFQVCNAMTAFCGNFFVVLRPPMVKAYADRDYPYAMRLFYAGSKFSFFLILMLFLPLMLEMPSILGLWLKESNEQMVLFSRLALIYALITAQNLPITSMIQATGQVKKYFAVVESATLMSLPLTYLFYTLGLPAEFTFYASILVFSVAHLLRVWILRTTLPGIFSLREYLRAFVAPALWVGGLSALCCYGVHYGVGLSSLGVFSRLVTVCVASLLSVGGLAWGLGLNAGERRQFLSILHRG